jgi:ADP-heptose:LPS heptosyltransferase
VNEFVFVKRKNSPLHEAQLNIQLLKGIGIHELPDVQQLHKYVSFSANKVVPEKISSLITPHKKRIILHPKSAGSAREWPWQHYSSLADLLNPADYDILLCGTTKEKKMLEKSGANFPKHVIDIMGMLSLDEYIELISSSNAIVAASTGPLHIGAACGIFAIGIYPVIKPMHPARWQPIGENALYLSSSKSSCNSCRRTPASCVCMNDVTPQQVFKIIEANGK